jgi:putative redox protein
MGNKMNSTVNWIANDQFETMSPSGHLMTFDGQGESGPSPMEHLISALGACSSIDVVMILQKGRHAVSSCRCELTAERAETSPRVFTRIHAHFVVEGEGLSQKHVERAVSLSLEKYCSVALMLQETVEISHSSEWVQ